MLLFSGTSVAFLWMFALVDLVPMDAFMVPKLREVRITVHRAPLIQCVGMALAFLGILVTGSATKWSADEGYVYLVVVAIIHQILSLRIILTMRKRIHIANRVVLPT